MSKKPISQNYYRGKKVRSHEELSSLSKRGESVYKKEWGIKPAVFIINLPYCMLVEVIRKGELYNITK